MNRVLKPFLRKCVLVLFDDILIYSRDKVEHRHHLQQVLLLLRDNRLFINRKKCSFEQETFEYMEHVISRAGVAADPKKVAAVVNWPPPSDLKGLIGFFGLKGYYRRFVKNYGKIAWPLTQLLKKDNFKWNEEAQATFDKLKLVMTTLPVLAIPSFDKTSVVEADAPGKGMGAVLTQEGRPVAHMSHTLPD